MGTRRGRERLCVCQILFIWSSQSHFCLFLPCFVVLFVCSNETIPLASLSSDFRLDAKWGQREGPEGGQTEEVKWGQSALPALCLPDHECGSSYIPRHPSSEQTVSRNSPPAPSHQRGPAPLVTSLHPAHTIYKTC